MTPPSRPSLDALAAGELDATDDDVLARLRDVYDAVDPVPAGLVDRVRFGITLDALHAELAELQRAGDPAGVRGADAGEAQTITFTSAHLTTMVTIVPLAGDRVRIDGWAAPGARLAVDLRSVAQTTTVHADDDGRFVFESVPRGLAQFVLRRPGGGGPGSVVVTPSIEI